MTEKELFDRYSAVRLRIQDSCRQAGRASEEVRLVAVSKFHPAEDIAAVAAFGQKDFGENYIQEALDKMKMLAGLNLRWHAIGPIQSNKARDVAGRFVLIHSLATESLAAALERRMTPDTVQDVLIQVNIGEEAQKSGVSAQDLPAFAEKLATMASIRVQGLMCLPPLSSSAEESRPYFQRLRLLKEDLAKRLGMPLPHLSMGMSADFPEAIAEGATIIRVGTEIFGPRHV